MTTSPRGMPVHGQDGLAEKVGELFLSNPYSRGLNLAILQVVPGEAHIRCEPLPQHMNRHGTWHGGAIWTIADMVFGAAGFYDGFILTAGSDLTFVRPASGSETLHAKARQITRKGKTGIFEIVISTRADDPDSVVATGMFTGRWAA